jgi:teichuronic acid biosynthesis glycosyltransferase TuaH
MPQAGLKRMPDWLVLAQEEWDEVERRNQLLIRALADRHPRSRFLFAEIPLRPREVRHWRPPRLRQVGANIWSVRPIRPLPDGGFRHLSDRVEVAQVRRAMRTLRIERPFLWTQDPRSAELVEQLPVSGIVYDLTDDWVAFEADSRRRRMVQGWNERLAARADVVFACSRVLEGAAHAWSDRVRYLPNGVDPPGGDAPEPPDLQSLRRPRLGYVGTLHASRLDVELLARAAELRPSWSFVLLGPDQLGAHDRERLFSLPNVHYLGVRPHRDVRGYLAALDVGLLVHRDTEFTRSLDPLKIYEYLAAGLPIVATPVGNFDDLGDHVVFAVEPGALVTEAERVIAGDSAEHGAARRASVAGATWDARAGDVERSLGVAPEDAVAAGPASVSVVIVSHNTRDLLERCLLDVRSQTGVAVQTIVVDNASTDGSVELVREQFPEVELVALDENVGFARANTIAFERCRAEFTLLLNSDAFLAQGALCELVAVARRHPRAGAVGPRLHYPDGRLQRSAWPFPQAGRLLLEAFGLHRPLRRLGLIEDLGTWGHDEERTVDFLIGACLLLRSDALQEVGGFDESFWLYAEEADLQRRLASCGWQVLFTPAAATTHVGSASSDASVVRMRHFYTGQMRFLTKHGSRLSWPVARLALLIGSLLRGRWSIARLAIDLKR